VARRARDRPRPLRLGPKPHGDRSLRPRAIAPARARGRHGAALALAVVAARAVVSRARAVRDDGARGAPVRGRAEGGAERPRPRRDRGAPRDVALAAADGEPRGVAARRAPPPRPPPRAPRPRRRRAP